MNDEQYLFFSIHIIWLSSISLNSNNGINFHSSNHLLFSRIILMIQSQCNDFLKMMQCFSSFYNFLRSFLIDFLQRFPSHSTYLPTNSSFVWIAWEWYLFLSLYLYNGNYYDHIIYSIPLFFRFTTKY